MGERRDQDDEGKRGISKRELRAHPVKAIAGVFIANVSSGDFFDPTPETQNVVLVDARTLRQAEKLIIGCEGCAPEDAELPFDNVLDRVTGNDLAVTDYVMVESMAKCPQCKRKVNEKTLVEVE